MQRMMRTLSVNIRVLPEAILHRLELFDTVNSLGFLLRKYETRKCLAELHTAGTMCHPTEARTVPIDFPRDGIKSTARGCFFLFFRQSLVILLVYTICMGL